MAPSHADKQPFRFLDLPAELRCCVYESIGFPTTWHVLDRVNSHIDKRNWPVPPKAQIYDSRVTLIRPYTQIAINILLTCRLVSKEAHPILERMVERCRSQPIRYLVDYSAAFALVKPSSILRSCLDVADETVGEFGNIWIKEFLQLGLFSLCRQYRSQISSRNIPAIELTITHKSGVLYGAEVFEAFIWLYSLKHSCRTRLVVVYKCPLPRIQMPNDTQTTDPYHLEEMFLSRIPREPGIGDQTIPDHGVFLRPLEEEAFGKHVNGLEFY